MTNWKKYKLSELCTKIGSGATPRGGDASYKSSGISLIRSQNVLDFTFSKDGLAFIDEQQAKELSNVEIKERDILLNITGDSVARVCQVPDKILPARVNQHVCILRPNLDKLDPEYLKYCLLSKENKERLLVLASIGSTRKALTKGMLEDFKIELPDIDIQIRISSILSSFDNKIELNRLMNQTLEKISIALFNKYFIDDINPKNLPKGWRSGKLSETTLRITKGTTPTTLQKQFVESGINFLKVESLTDFGTFDLSKFSFIDADTDALLSRSRIQESDILFSIAGTLGRVAKVSHSILPANTNQALAIIRPDKNIIHPLFIYYYLKIPTIKDDILSNSVQGVQANLSLGVLSNTKILIPRKEYIDEILSLIEPFHEEIEQNENEISFLIKARDSLLSKLMSGELEISSLINQPTAEKSDKVTKKQGSKAAKKATIKTS